ncbi:hypothetical protein BT93_D1225 [Corymbia citriodora subsp. variegata]|nr:hypothetical protein BT93_D1225 [Corymbia citriodora subsp. variegata]
MVGEAIHPPPLKTPSPPPDTCLPSPSSPPPSRSTMHDDSHLPMTAGHCKIPPCSASASVCLCQPGEDGGEFGLFASVPTVLEIENAIRALLALWQATSSSGSVEEWARLIGCSDPSISTSSGLGRVQRALYLLQREPAIKNLVISLVLDKNLWSAIMNNQSVKKVQEFLLSGGTTRGPVKTAVQMGAKDETGSPQICLEEIDLGTNNLRWLLDMLKDKIMDLIEKFKLLFIAKFQPSQPVTPEAMAELGEKVDLSFLLSVLIILIIVMGRVRTA